MFETVPPSSPNELAVPKLMLLPNAGIAEIKTINVENNLNCTFSLSASGFRVLMLANKIDVSRMNAPRVVHKCPAVL